MTTQRASIRRGDLILEFLNWAHFGSGIIFEEESLLGEIPDINVKVLIPV